MQDWTEDEIQTLKRLHEDGFASHRIAEAIPGKTVHQVRRVITEKRQELGLAYRHHPTQPEEVTGSFSCDRCKDLLRKPWKS